MDIQDNGGYTNDPNIKRTDWQRNIVSAAVDKVAKTMVEPKMSLLQELLANIGKLNNCVKKEAEKTWHEIPNHDIALKKEYLTILYLEHLQSWNEDEMRHLCSIANTTASEPINLFFIKRSDFVLQVKALFDSVKQDCEPFLKLMPIKNEAMANERLFKSYFLHLQGWTADDMRELTALVMAAQQLMD